MRCLVPVALLALSGCAAFTDYAEPPAHEPPAMYRDVVWRNQLPASPLHMEVSASPSILAWGDTLVITARLVNDLGNPVGVQFANGCTGGHSLWAGNACVWRPDRGCTMAPVTRVFDPGEGPPFTITWVWDQKRIRPGSYRFVVGLGEGGDMDSGEAAIILRSR